MNSESASSTRVEDLINNPYLPHNVAFVVFWIVVFIHWFPVRFIRHWIFASSWTSETVVGHVKQALVAGVIPRSQPDDGPSIDIPNFYYDMELEYSYKGKTYHSQAPAMKKYYLPLPMPKVPYEQETWEVLLVRGYAPDAQFKYFHLRESLVSFEHMLKHFAQLDPGVPDAEIPIRVFKWHPAWNYFNVRIPDAWTTQDLLYGFGLAPLFLLLGIVNAVYRARIPWDTLVSRSWVHCLVAAVLATVLMIWIRARASTIPTGDAITHTIESTQFPSLKKDSLP